MKRRIISNRIKGSAKYTAPSRVLARLMSCVRGGGTYGGIGRGAKCAAVVLLGALVAACGEVGGGDGSFDFDLSIREPQPECSSPTVDHANYSNSADGRDPLENYQWYLAKHYVYEAWRKVPQQNRAGSGIEIAVIDDDLQLNHEDLAANIIPNASLDLNAGTGDILPLPPVPRDCNDVHGTSVAGIIGAVGGNRRGLRGIAYEAKIWGANFISYSGGGTDASLRLAFRHRLNATAIASNSWGTFAPTQLAAERPPYILTEAFTRGINTGYPAAAGAPRGISYVFAAGNSRQTFYTADGRPIENYLELASYEEMLNHIGVIPVCAVGVDDRFSSYSEAGTNLWVCGYSDSGRLEGVLNTAGALTAADEIFFQYVGVPSLDLGGDAAGYNRGGASSFTYDSFYDECVGAGSFFDFATPSFMLDPRCANQLTYVLLPQETTALSWPPGATTSYTRHFGGTSAAAPAVSGIIALVRAANRALTWRDVKLILAGSAWMPAHAGAAVGARTYHNPSVNYTHHMDYGFGIANASKAVDLAMNWQPLPELLEWNSGGENGDRGLNSDMISYQPAANSTNNITFVEYVNVEILGNERNRQSNFGVLDITLISPNGRQSVFTRAHQCVGPNLFGEPEPIADCEVFRNSFTFGSAAHLGEDPRGQWRLQVSSTTNPSLNHLQWRLTLHGHR